MKLREVVQLVQKPEFIEWAYKMWEEARSAPNLKKDEVYETPSGIRLKGEMIFSGAFSFQSCYMINRLIYAPRSPEGIPFDIILPPWWKPEGFGIVWNALKRDAGVWDYEPDAEVNFSDSPTRWEFVQEKRK